MNRITALLIFLLFVTSSFAQITKNNWMVGGTARFKSVKEKQDDLDVSTFTIDASTNLGYFFIDKMAGGLNLGYNYFKYKNLGVVSHSSILKFGPFVRYYLLPADSRINVLTQIAYSHGSDFNEYSTNSLNLAAGPVIYFNSSVGLEFTLNYERFSSNSNTSSANSIFLGIGFQIHLEKENNP